MTEIETRNPEEDKSIDLSHVPANVQQLVARLNNAAGFSSSVDAQLDIMSRILEAETLEGIFEAADTGSISGKEFAGRPFVLKSGDYDWKRSAPGFVRQGGFPYYALLKVTALDDGKEYVIDCGGFSFVSVLDRLDCLGWIEKATNETGGLPLMLEARQMASGFEVLIPHLYNGPMWRPEPKAGRK